MEDKNENLKSLADKEQHFKDLARLHEEERTKKDKEHQKEQQE